MDLSTDELISRYSKLKEPIKQIITTNDGVNLPEIRREYEAHLAFKASCLKEIEQELLLKLLAFEEMAQKSAEKNKN